jgi:hypothetical protein
MYRLKLRLRVGLVRPAVGTLFDPHFQVLRRTGIQKAQV